jgi:hypothetical protein
MMSNPRWLAFEKNRNRTEPIRRDVMQQMELLALVLWSHDWFKSLRKRSAHAIPKAPLSQAPASPGEARSR